MAITIYIHADDHSSFEISDGMEETSTDNNQRLSLEEFDALADKLADLSMKIDGPDARPLSDYAMSRESIYEDYPKL